MGCLDALTMMLRSSGCLWPFPDVKPACTDAIRITLTVQAAYIRWWHLTW
jgi:hypothetical protein